ATGFIGSEAVAAARKNGTNQKLVPVAIEGEGIARQGNPVVGGGEGTSGTFSPSLERGIGMAYVSSARAEPGTPIEIDVRGRTRPAEIERKPLYKKGASPGRPRAFRTASSPTPSTPGRALTVTPPHSGSRGTHRTPWARWCSSTRPRS